MTEEQNQDEIGEKDVYIHVGEGVELSEDATKALQDLAAALDEQASDEVSGFAGSLFGMMMGGGGMIMAPDVKVSGEPGEKGDPIKIGVSKCAIDVSIRI